MRCVGKHSLGAAGLKGICSMAKCSCCINDVIDDYAGASFDFSDDIHNFGNVSSGAAFVDNGEIAFHALSDGTGANNAADVRRYNNQIGIVMLPQIT